MSDQLDLFDPASVADFVRIHRKDKHGVICPGCGRRANEYPEAMGVGPAKALVILEYVSRPEYSWVHVPSVFKEVTTQDPHKLKYSKLAHWELLEPQPKRTLYPAPRSGVEVTSAPTGFWRLTKRGIEFAQGLISIPKRVWIFDKKCMGFVDEGDLITLAEALKRPFDIRDVLKPPLARGEN